MKNAKVATVPAELTEREAADAPTRPLKKGLPRILLLAGLGMGLAAAGVAGFHWWQYASSHEETDDAYVSGHIHPVSARINGTVQKVLIDDNQPVKVGQPLVLLDPRDYQVQLQQAQAALAVAKRQAETARSNIAFAAGRAGAQQTTAGGNVGAAEAAIRSAQSVVVEAQAGIPAAQAQLAQANANLTKARLDYERYQNLEKEGVVARQQLDTARATYQVQVAARDAAAEGVRQAQARLAQARQGVANARAGLLQSEGSLQDARAANLQTDVNRAQYEAALAAVQQAEANVRNAQLQLSYTRIAAPIAGRIGKRTVEAGQRVQPGQPLLSVVQNQVWVTANFKETQLAHMRPGQTVEVKVDALGGKAFEGRVNSFSPGSGQTFALLPADNATGNFTKIVQRVPVKIVLDPASVRGYEPLLVPGLSVTSSVEVK
ncbi:HlyD family secretion protein [Gloeobacter kilaueensis]|uniref:Secretion protein HlyD family protein n=1 Tax=Gloeobacter kilaueensis (strain ATCC BAA-2537 / CCAP 1431/1 / ULC 316 / JS1) TaxID=1183438 RepID=U5QSR2_GLOK1|nr:HlyD family secretion protein [Gloeobacter kilaueensis]AGY60714.1 secretion protein HlyD family protein [Gloeobacter kilaueensis JS1]